MKISALIPVSLVVVIMVAALTFSASAACSTCSKEEDWSKSATSFLEGTPINETQEEFGPKVARMASSQFEKKSEADQMSPAIAAPARASPAASADAQPAIVLVSVNADHINVSAGNAVNITALFATTSAEKPTDSSNASLNSESRITASATIKNSTGINAANVVLIKTSGNEYTGIWNASVLPGIYSLSISASSLQGSETFNDALQINVLEPAVTNLG